MKNILLLIVSCCLSIVATQASAGFLTLFLARSHPNCPQALPMHHAKFRASFEAAAECQCHSSGMPRSMCKDMKALYSRMLFVFGSVQKACEFQRDTPTKTCLANWRVYLKNSRLGS